MGLIEAGFVVFGGMYLTYRILNWLIEKYVPEGEEIEGVGFVEKR